MEPTPDPKATRRKRIRLAVSLLLVLILLAVAAITTRYFVMRQYYVGVGDTNEVTVFQGVSGSILGIDLSRKSEGSCVAGDALCEPLMLANLQQDAREVLCQGQKRDSLDAAREYITFLRHHKRLDPPATPGARPEEVSCNDTTDVGGG